MLRTSLRIVDVFAEAGVGDSFLSSNAQDFIEEVVGEGGDAGLLEFLSSNAQDFIEEGRYRGQTGTKPYS